MNAVSRESLAIVSATCSDVSRHQPAITLRMWHHLMADPERDTLFGVYGGGTGGEPATLMQALLAAIPLLESGRWPRLRAAPGLTGASLPPLERAFGQALVDVIGGIAVPMVVHAWCDVMRSFLAELHRQGGGAA